MTNQEILRMAMEQHAIDLSCAPEDFVRADNVVVVSRANENARRYLELPFFCNLVTYGGNIVASVDERVADFVRAYIGGQKTEHCFATPALHLLTPEFAKYGKAPGFMAQFFLPDMDSLRALPCAYETRLLEPGDFSGLYLPRWSNALCEKRKTLDMLAVAAYDSDEIIGLAGCSADCDAMWQIGIDVLPGARRQGVAAALTSRLALEVLARGKVPFYGCAWANIGSARNALRSGFRPAWAELTAIDATKGEG